MHDKMLNFFDRKALATTASGSITSKVVDLRYNGDDIDHQLFIQAFLDAAPTRGAVTFKLQTSDDGETWTDVVQKANSGEKLFAGPLPLGLKRYVRCTASVGTTALDAARTVWAEITDTLDADLNMEKVQKWSSTPGAGPEKLAPEGDAVHAAAADTDDDDDDDDDDDAGGGGSGGGAAG